MKTAFLVGAGFSYPAGVPIMRELAANFPDGLEGDDKQFYEQIRELVQEIERDFEVLFEICHDLQEVPVGLLNRLAFKCFGEKFVSLEGLAQRAQKLDYRLKEFLREKCGIKKNKLQYMYPLMQRLKRDGSKLDVFTLNYDLMIEVLCEEFMIPYTDGFLVKWEPDLFGQEKFQVRLFKLHGSFVWYQSKIGERIKIPILEYDTEVKYFTQDTVASMMVYPRREKREPFNELLQMFRDRLLLLDKLVVIGYSFRDEEILEMVLGALAKNLELQLEIVSPNAEDMVEFFGKEKRITYFSGGVEEWINGDRGL